MPLPVVDTLSELVKTPSVNPMGREVAGDEFLEHKMTRRLEEIFDRMGLPHARQQVAPQRENIIARLDGEVPPEEGGPLLVLEAHQDTVPVDGMTIAPWSGEVRDERVWGRGSCDIKGGMACMLAALSRLAESRPAGMPTILMACSVNEEHGYSGALQMAASWKDGQAPLVPRLPDAVVVAEPTELDIVVAHKGVVRWRCHAHGRASHSSTPHLGDNAIYRMARVVSALERCAEEVVPQAGRHALVGTPTLSVGVIKGGISVNTVPDDCTIEIDRRVLPGEDPVAARRQIIDFVAHVLENDPQIEHEDPFICSGGLAEAHNGPLASALAEACREAGAAGRPIGVPYGTDAPAFDGIGIPTVVFGPGSIAQAHTCDEWVAIEQLEKATDILYRFASEDFKRL